MLADGPAGKTMTSRQAVLHMGCWPHAKAPGGKLEITEARLDEVLKNFNDGVGLAGGGKGSEMPAHIGHTEHVDDRSVAWAHKLEKVAIPGKPGQFKLVALANITDPKVGEQLARKEYRYVSPTLVFGYKDRTTGKTHDTVMRNFAFTNYPFLQGMGEVEVMNLSEVTLAELELNEELALDAATLDGSGAQKQGNPNPDGLPKGYEMASLPKQCSTCARLGNDCPFAMPTADVDLSLKVAAAESGNCPQYVESDQNSPGGGGAADAAGVSPTNNRTPGLQMSESKIAYGTPHKTMLQIIEQHSREITRGGHVVSIGADALHPLVAGNTQEHIKTRNDLIQGGAMKLKDMRNFQSEAGSGEWPKGESAHRALLTAHGRGVLSGKGTSVAMAYKNGGEMTHEMRIALGQFPPIVKPFEPAKMGAVLKHLSGGPMEEHALNRVPEAKQTGFGDAIDHLVKGGHVLHTLHSDKGMDSGTYSITPTGTAAMKDPTKLPGGTSTAKLTDRRTNKEPIMATKTHASLKARLAEFETQEQTQFVTALGEKYGLTADALKTIEATFTAGGRASVALGEALDSHSEALSLVQLADSDYSPALPESVTRLDLDDSVLISRKALREAFVALAQSERTEVGLADTTAVDGAPNRGEVELKTQLAEMTDPKKAAAALDAAHAAGKC